MRLAALILLFSFSFIAYGQTGPAGVLTSSANVFWLKADVGPSSTVNATPISAWNDQSGNGINVAQTVAVQQPSFASNIMNGFPAIQFDNITASGQNDKMIGPDSPILDSTAGYTFFTVSRPQNFGDAHVIVSKRTTVSVDQSFMLFYYTANKFHVDIQTTNDRYPTNTVYNVNTNYIIDVVYDGTLPTATRSKTYNDQTLDIAAAETSSLVPNNASPIILGTTDASDPRPYGGYISEVIIYRLALTAAPKIIIDNYLSAKYNIPLSANDKYAGDNPAMGNYDREIAGIGKESTGSNPSFSASISGGLTISSNSGLDNTDYALAGHASPTNYQITYDVGGMSGTSNARWLRIWYIDVTNTLTNLNVNVEFDMSDGGVSPVTLGPVANYVLLYRAGQTGNWTEVATANIIIGDRIIFNNYTLSDDGYYTIGTKNFLLSPLPIKLSSFDAIKESDHVNVTWTTESEKNNSSFTVQKSKDGINFTDVEMVAGVGNSSQKQNYKIIDEQPYEGMSYYRLATIDFSRQITYSNLVSVFFSSVEDAGFIISPNPSDGNFSISFKNFGKQADIKITELSGKPVYSTTLSDISNDMPYSLDIKNKLTQGVYLFSVSSSAKTYNQKIIIK